MVNQGLSETRKSDEFLVRSAKLSESIKVGPQLRTDGISSFTLDVKLKRNALVRVYDVVIKALSASSTPVESVAQVRATAASAAGPASIVLDFGTPRTVGGVSVNPSLLIAGITPWMGTAFAPHPVFPDPPASPDSNLVILRKEIRTERLLVEVTGTAAGDLWTDMAVVLPEAPTDLEIRIDGGAPVATFPGPAQPVPDSTLSENGWDKNGKRIVHLADAFAKLTGDPTNSDEVTFKLVLSSRIPGVLGIEIPPSPVVIGPPKLSYIRRVRFDAETSKELVFSEEGIQKLTLAGLPSNPSVEEIRFTVTGTLPPERIIPPVGPVDAAIADLVISQDRAVCVRLRSDTGLSELTGVRLPLRVGSGGAEMRVVLWREGNAEPVEVMPDGVSEPVTLNAGSDGETWTTFLFKPPVPISDEEHPNLPHPWVALIVSRGEVTWALGATKGPHDPINEHTIRRGAPTGPWKPLPEPFRNPASSLSLVRGRIRVIGHAPKDKPLAPLSFSIESPAENVPHYPYAQAIDVTPTAKGTAHRRSFSPGVNSPDLYVVSKIPGNVTLRDLDVVTNE
jgi:hypothetical protein